MENKDGAAAAQVDPEIKEKAEAAISMYYYQIVYHKGIPFRVVLPY